MPHGVNRLRVTQMNDTENIYVSLNQILSPNTQQFDVHPHSACNILLETTRRKQRKRKHERNNEKKMSLPDLSLRKILPEKRTRKNKKLKYHQKNSPQEI